MSARFWMIVTIALCLVGPTLVLLSGSFRAEAGPTYGRSAFAVQCAARRAVYVKAQNGEFCIHRSAFAIPPRNQ